MTTSNSTVFELTRDQIIDRALRILGVIALGQTPSTTEYTNAQIALNGVVARFNTLGMPLWKRTQSTVSLVASTTSYTVNNAIKVADVYLRNISSGTQYKLQWKSLYDINNLPSSSTGVPVHWSYTPNLAEGGTIRIWPIPTTTEVSQYNLQVVYQDEFDTFTASTETPDFPAYWSDALVFGLASVLANEYGISLQDRQDIDKKALLYLAQAQSYGDEDGSITFAPDYRY